MVFERDKYSAGRLTVSFENADQEVNVKKGVQLLGLSRERDGFIYVPQDYSRSNPAALAVMLHGAGATPEQGLSLLREFADEKNILLLAPASRQYSWDIIASDTFGPDVIFLEQALAQTLETYAIDPALVAIGGFSDGASYALSIGLTNGDLFTHIIAFSPGFSYTLQNTGKPAIFVSHGVHDPVLPIDPCSRRFVPLLKQNGLNVNYIEFDGEHEIPFNIKKRAVEWFVKDK